jgi:hypothetical protein
VTDTTRIWFRALGFGSIAALIYLEMTRGDWVGSGLAWLAFIVYVWELGRRRRGHG